MPPPEVFEAYDLVLPGAADRILTMAELDTRHGQKMEETALLTYRREIELARLAAMLVPVAGIIAAAIVGVIGSPYVAGLLAAGSFSAPFMAALLRQRRDETRTLQRQREQAPPPTTGEPPQRGDGGTDAP